MAKLSAMLACRRMQGKLKISDKYTTTVQLNLPPRQLAGLGNIKSCVPGVYTPGYEKYRPAEAGLEMPVTMLTHHAAGGMING